MVCDRRLPYDRAVPHPSRRISAYQGAAPSRSRRGSGEFPQGRQHFLDFRPERQRWADELFFSKSRRYRDDASLEPRMGTLQGKRQLRGLRTHSHPYDGRRRQSRRNDPDRGQGHPRWA